MYQLQLKNMVCPRCVSSVGTILARLEIPYEKISLGEVVLKENLRADKESELKIALKEEGFELITTKQQRIANQIKSIIIEGVYQGKGFFDQTLSAVLSEKMHQDYSRLSATFSISEGKSIQDFQHDVKIMRIKELLEYDELNISEIADELGYGNAAYLSTQFKKATGLTPSAYKNLQLKNRNSLDTI